MKGRFWPTAAIRVVENYAYCIAAFDVGAAIPLTQIRIAACDPEWSFGSDNESGQSDKMAVGVLVGPTGG